MNETTKWQEIFAKYGEALRYPGPALTEAARDLHALLVNESLPAAQKVEFFIHILESGPLDAFEEHYTRAFDLSPLAVPYLSVYLFGAENPQRGQFMAGLMAAYGARGHACHGELPDHLAVVLGYAALAPEAEWEEMRELCLPAPVKHMRHGLQEADNPYQHLLASLECFMQHVAAGVLSHA